MYFVHVKKTVLTAKNKLQAKGVDQKRQEIITTLIWASRHVPVAVGRSKSNLGVTYCTCWAYLFQIKRP